MIQLSLAAVNEIERLKSKQQPNIFFRLQVKPGGCSGLFYDIAFDAVVKVEDQVFYLDNIQVIIDTQTLNYIKGLKLDYSEDLMGGGFQFHNPLAISTCSCGNSFSIIQ
ncbi:iron-sulfur cluster assembly accessory protein [Anabaena cylindrica FACHB-243]|nr:MULTISPECIES: iron-sulfur cluster assembly accessory protein [Anabaena]MBD2419705.1 iron-sulfur cluster assembly accessory protein [Anabaena cylindrica FACHB-243]MBY5281592.1 iron-sulfur cluster assembly accessory protein [Anabaena sp. CCAP 1446/1C]MBY5307155.1 iron-sulfur cluster assembly accessory protein [Anabaena sp. CCAP 1446/1C]MCM2409225.1 iron-sulfur cluster assembly accessory protein [Anabaena sp. CCAP 1446/1C]